MNIPTDSMVISKANFFPRRMENCGIKSRNGKFIIWVNIIFRKDILSNSGMLVSVKALER
jgi:hypothetical protein